MNPYVPVGRYLRLFAAHRRPRARNDSGVSFVYAIVALGAMLILGLTFLQVGLNSAKWAYGHYRDQQAFALAESAIDHAIWMMQASVEGDGGINTALDVSMTEAAAGIQQTFTSETWTLPTGAYRFVAKAPYKGIYGTAEVRGTGIDQNGHIAEVCTVLTPTYPDPGGSDRVPPACFQHAMFSDHNLLVNGSPQILGHPEVGGAGLYANGNITFTGTSSVIYGPISATGTITGTTTQVPATAGRYENAPRESMPTIDLAYFKSIADVMYTGDPVKFTSGYDASAGTYDDPVIIFVDGTAQVAGNFTGVGVIVATDGIDVTGSVTYGAPGSSWAFVTAGNFTTKGATQIHGLIYCHNATGTADFIGTGTPNIYGGVIADVITINGNYITEWDADPLQIAELPGMARLYYPPVVDTLYWERM
jgi:hypothetical protein